jgi:hypothetical protein
VRPRYWATHIWTSAYALLKLHRVVSSVLPLKSRSQLSEIFRFHGRGWAHPSWDYGLDAKRAWDTISRKGIESNLLVHAARGHLLHAMVRYPNTVEATPLNPA